MDDIDWWSAQAARLEGERRRAAEQLAARSAEYRAASEAAMTDGRDDEHDPDGSTPAGEHALAFALREAAVVHLAEVERAGRCWEAGTYGRCEGCGSPIAPARLEAVPTARTCVTCPPLGR